MAGGCLPSSYFAEDGTAGRNPITLNFTHSTSDSGSQCNTRPQFQFHEITPLHWETNEESLEAYLSVWSLEWDITPIQNRELRKSLTTGEWKQIMNVWESEYEKTKKPCCIYIMSMRSLIRKILFYITLMFHEAALEQDMNLLWRRAESERRCSFQIKRPPQRKSGWMLKFHSSRKRYKPPCLEK